MAAANANMYRVGGKFATIVYIIMYALATQS